MNIVLLEYFVKVNGYTWADMQKKLGISRTAFYRKRNGVTEFTLAEIQTIVKTLGLSPDEAYAVFFAKEVAHKDTRLTFVSA